jgi:hypothetical protein
MHIDPLLIPDRYFGEPIPIAPDLNQVVDKVDELVAAVNAGLATSNAIVGGPKYVRYLSSQYYNVPADALTLDRLDAATILPGNTAVVINSSATPLTDTQPSQQYVATIVADGTAGAVVVPAYTGAPAGTTVPIKWQLVSTADTFTALLEKELPAGKEKFAGLDLRPLLIAIIGDLGAASTVVVTTPAPPATTPAPTVTGFLPGTAVVGASVTVTGTGFTKATAVLFHGTAASFQVVNATTLIAVVPLGATTGPVSVATAAGTGTSAADFVIGAPPETGTLEILDVQGDDSLLISAVTTS